MGLCCYNSLPWGVTRTLSCTAESTVLRITGLNGAVCYQCNMRWSDKLEGCTEMLGGFLLSAKRSKVSPTPVGSNLAAWLMWGRRKLGSRSCAAAGTWLWEQAMISVLQGQGTMPPNACRRGSSDADHVHHSLCHKRESQFHAAWETPGERNCWQKRCESCVKW